MCSTRSPTRRPMRQSPSATSASYVRPASSTRWPTGNARASGVAPPSASVGASTGSVASRPDRTPALSTRRPAPQGSSPPVVTSNAPPDPLVAALIGSLAAHRPADEREERSLATILDALTALPRPFDRHADLAHVTASAVV